MEFCVYDCLVGLELYGYEPEDGGECGQVTDVSLTVAVAAAAHCKNIRISTDILWRVFHILTEPYTFVSANRRNNEARAHRVGQKISVDIRKIFTVQQCVYACKLRDVCVCVCFHNLETTIHTQSRT